MRRQYSVGDVFGRLTLLAYAAGRKCLYRCACGTEKLLDRHAVARLATKSCGCLNAELASAHLKRVSTKHGRHIDPAYKCWSSMRERCNNPANLNYSSYGGRGIKVCRRWDSFALFLVDMGPRPSGMSIERKDNDRGYSPENCVWATMKTQAENRRNTVLLTHNGETRTLSAWAAAMGAHPSTLAKRLAAGMPLAQAIERPLQRSRGT